MQFATFGGGCFWGIEALFSRQAGVVAAISGYEGGVTDNPSYQAVCLGTTGHAEVVQIHFDDNIISYQQLLALFFANHNPTQLNRQGVDIGTQYRSVIFYHNDAQRDIAHRTIAELSRQEPFDSSPIVTQVTACSTFYPAEEYHQQYYAKNGGSCSI